MDTDDKPGRKMDPANVRDQLDEVLAREITALLDVDSNLAMLSFNLASISCITLIIEREREIKQYADSPPERYTKESFANELIDIGLEQDDTLENTINQVLTRGYISINSKGELKAEMPAFMMLGFLDSMFPGMQGMNLVAFVLQMNEEVNSGRKSFELARQSFKSTLKSRGVSVSKDRAEKKASEIVSGDVATSSQSKEISRKLKKNNLNRLSKLIKKRKKRSLDSSSRLKIKDVFDKGPTKEELEVQKAEIIKAEQAAKKAAELARELAEKEEKIREAEEAAKEAARQLREIELREEQLLKAQQEALKAKQKVSDIEAREAMMAEKEAKLKALEEKLKRKEEQKLQQEKEARQKLLEEEQLNKVSQSDEDIESQIAAFESNLTMPCPLCKEGEIVSKTTLKGKDFFSCTKPDCRFVSWDKPYHFECPLCKNSFLTETLAPNGEKGLKCPRASCSYTQDNLLDPKQNMAAKAATMSAPKKKKKLVRRRKRR
ncbi:MAG: DNA topoisomerase I [Deltaproteobacteria bacterium]|nr:DNA topoisomerase I [Deltaproteobacteria bacterium]